MRLCIIICLGALICPILIFAQIDSTHTLPDYPQISVDCHFAFNGSQYYGFGFDEQITKRLIIEQPLFGFSCIAYDPFSNKRRGNASVYQLVAPLLLGPSLYWIQNKEPPDYAFSGLNSLLNSTLSYIINDLGNTQSDRKKILVSVFVKTETDWFVFRENDWVQMSPGIGIKLVYSRFGNGLTLYTGYQNSFQYDFRGNSRNQGVVFFRIGLKASDML